MSSTDTWSAKTYADNASFVYSDAFTAPVLKLLDARLGERILDLGCGNGELTVKIGQLVGEEGRVLGTDFSESMITKANTLTAAHPNTTFLIHDASSLSPTTPLTVPSSSTQPPYDAIFSNAALHWILHSAPQGPLPVLQALHSLLANPGGRFAAEMGGYLNCIGLRSALWQSLKKRGYDAQAMDTWYFPSPAEMKSLLTQAGFNVRSIELVPRITRLPGGIVGWLETFWRSGFLKRFEEVGDSKLAKAKQAEAQEIMEEVEDALRPDCYDAFDGSWSVMYVRLRFEAVV